MKKSTISITLLVLLFLGSVETFAQKQIVRRVPNKPVVPQKQAQPTKTPTHHEMDIQKVWLKFASMVSLALSINRVPL